MSNVQTTITNLPQAGPILGTEAVPIVQNGVTKQTTTAAIAASPSQTQTFLTLNQEPTLPNSRYLSTGTGLGLSDGGAQSYYRITLNGASGSLEGLGNGFVVKDSGNSVINRTIQVSGNGLAITNGSGVAGNPIIALDGLSASLAGMSGSGLVTVLNGTTVTPRSILGVADQIAVTNGNAFAGNPSIGLADNTILPGTGAVTITSGTTAQQPIGSAGQFRFNLDTQTFDGYASGVWRQFSLSGGVTSFSGGSTGLTPATPTSGGIILGGVLNASSGGTGASTLTGYVKGNGIGVMTASATVPTTDLSGTVSNAQLANSAITINGSTVSLGDSVTVTATASNALTIGTGLSGTSYNGSAAVTIAIDSTVATLTGTQTLTNKTLADPEITGTVKLTGSGASAYTPFIQTFSSSVTNFNGYQLNYIQNANNGSDSSVDYVAYNDSSDVDSYFVDMGIASSNYTNALNTVFPANSGYLYTGGGTSGQASPLLLGTSNTASDITLFTGGTLLANTRATIKGNTGNVLINTTTDTGYKLNVNGTTYFGGASVFGSTVLLNADPTLALQAVTKQYVDAAVSTGFVVHPAVVYATATALPANTYNNGASGVGATLTAVVNGALSVDGNAVTTSQRILVKNEVVQANNGAYTVTQTGSAILPYILTRATDFDTVGAGEIANNAYFFVTAGSTNQGSSFILSQTAAITVGTTALPFTLFNDQLDYVGGTNINVTGLTISLTGTVAATNGGTGTSTVTTGDLLYGSATNTWSKLPLGISYKSLIVNAAGTQMEWNAIPLNQTTAVSGQLGASNGGTGLSAYAIGDIVYASASTTLSKLALGTQGYVLTAGATGPTWSGIAGGTF